MLGVLCRMLGVLCRMLGVLLCVLSVVCMGIFAFSVVFLDVR